MRAVIIVAHPDDEVIWSGGLILRHPQWEWTVLSLCRADDADRRPKFERVCSVLGATGIVSDLDDSATLKAIDPEVEIGGRVLAHLGGRDWDLCLTHGPNGEYGHERHKQVHRVVKMLVEREQLRCRRLWTFAYDYSAEAGACLPADWADRTLALSPQELGEKKRIVREEYGYPEDGFELRACISPECFARLKDPGKELRL